MHINRYHKNKKKVDIGTLPSLQNAKRRKTSQDDVPYDQQSDVQFDLDESEGNNEATNGDKFEMDESVYHSDESVSDSLTIESTVKDSIG
eukprot:scaffold283473_cov156-Cyclotella_meneghiniana.AAC.1